MIKTIKTLFQSTYKLNVREMSLLYSVLIIPLVYWYKCYQFL